MVILATPPHFRPAHLKAAIAAGKHVFCEKPVAVDAPGVRSVLATTEVARTKNLAIVSGLCYRYDPPKREVINRIHDGESAISTLQVSYNTGTLWHRGRQPSWSEMEYQLRNWLYFTWLSGDFNVEQHVHSLDKAAWVMRDEPPLRATGLGGRQVRVEEQWGNIYDHFSVVYEYNNGVKLFAQCRQMAGCSVDVSDHVIGTKGSAEMMKATIDGPTAWRTMARSRTCTKRSIKLSSQAFARAARSTTVCIWHVARCWPSWAGWPVIRARPLPGTSASDRTRFDAAAIRLGAGANPTSCKAGIDAICLTANLDSRRLFAIVKHAWAARFAS